MPAYNFTREFAGAVERREKRQTIRRNARGATRGAIAYLYTGMRTKHCRKLGEATIRDVSPIELDLIGCGEPSAVLTYYNGSTSHYVHGDLDALARDDGFQNGTEMVAWFAALYGLPFKGFLIEWD